MFKSTPCAGIKRGGSVHLDNNEQ